MAHVDLGGQVEHHLGAVLLEDGVEVGGDDVGLDEEELRVLGQVLDVGGPTRGEVVQPHNGVTVAEETVDQRRPDESGRAGDQCTHRHHPTQV